MTRHEAITRIRAALRQRSGRAWSVRGLPYGQISIRARPDRCNTEDGQMQYGDRRTLRELLGLSELPHREGIRIGTLEDYQEYVDRAENRFSQTTRNDR